MKVYGRRRGCRLGLGVFDGYHRGHQALGDRATAIMTIFPHPEAVILGRQVPYLTTLRELNSMGVPLMILRFSTMVSQLEPDLFLDELWHQVQPTGLVVGEDFRFGKNQAGTLSVLEAWCQRRGVSLDIVPLVTEGNEPIKSSRIRQFIQNGEWDKACHWMGRPYRVMGRVVRGDGRGRLLGFPTANIRVGRGKVLPPLGVYRCQVDVAGGVPALLNCGVRPTFGGGQVQLEVHIPNQSLNLYGQPLTVDVGTMIRPECHFGEVGDLITQIREDIRQLLAGE